MKDMKNVTLIGASGFVGTALLNELLARGHKVTAVVRNLDKIGVWQMNWRLPNTTTSALPSDIKKLNRIITRKP